MSTGQQPRFCCALCLTSVSFCFQECGLAKDFSSITKSQVMLLRDYQYNRKLCAHDFKHLPVKRGIAMRGEVRSGHEEEGSWHGKERTQSCEHPCVIFQVGNAYVYLLFFNSIFKHVVLQHVDKLKIGSPQQRFKGLPLFQSWSLARVTVKLNVCSVTGRRPPALKFASDNT